MSESIRIALCRDTLAAGAALTLHVRGSSMLPVLWPGDSVVVEPTQVHRLRLGEIVVFARDGELVIHRIVRRAGDADAVTLTTRGDAQFHDDRPFDASAVLGVARAVRRFGTERPVGVRRLAASRALSALIRRSAMARFLLDALHSRLSMRSELAQRMRTAP